MEWNTASKRPRSQTTASGGSGSKDDKREQEGKPPWAHLETLAGEEQEDQSVEERLKDLEIYMARLSETIGGLRLTVNITANQMTDIQADLVEVKSWTSWLSRLYSWMGDSYRYFPWR
jgi:hypothetical protein